MNMVLKFATLSLLGFLAATVGIWLGDRNPTMSVVSVRTEPTEPGALLEVAYRINRFRLCNRNVYREIIDGDGLRHVLGSQQRPSPAALGYDAYTQLVYVPTAVRPGSGSYRVTIEDYCNPIHYLWPIVTSINTGITIRPASLSEERNPSDLSYPIVPQGRAKTP